MDDEASGSGYFDARDAWCAVPSSKGSCAVSLVASSRDVVEAHRGLDAHSVANIGDLAVVGTAGVRIGVCAYADMGVGVGVGVHVGAAVGGDVGMGMGTGMGGGLAEVVNAVAAVADFDTSRSYCNFSTNAFATITTKNG